MMNYRLRAIDLDWTLLCPEGKVSAENMEAVAQAQAAGLAVVPCTGRGWREAHYILSQVPSLGLGVFVTGAAVADIKTGQTQHHTPFELGLAAEVVAMLEHEPYAVLACREPNRIGHEYLVTGRGEMTANSRWWFDFTGAIVHEQRHVTADDLHHTLRIGMVVPGSQSDRVLAGVTDRLGGRVEAHAFAAVQSPDPEEAVHILEVFPPGVDKWHGLSWIAEQRGIGPDQIAVIGDEINDLAMLQAAGCSIAMDNAIDEAKQHAAYITKPNHEHGVAHAINQILGGHW